MPEGLGEFELLRHSLGENRSRSETHYRVLALHPEWRDYLLVSFDDKWVRHERSGSLGSFDCVGEQFRVSWDQHPAETYLISGGILIHESLYGSENNAYSDADTCGKTPIHVISLARTPERRAIFAALNAGLPYSFFDAVDGNTVDPVGLMTGGLIAGSLHYTRGAIGAALSHLALWEQTISDQMPLTVVEDDVILRRDFLSASQSVIQSLPTDWDLIMWGWNLDSLAIVDAMPGVTPFIIQSDQRAMRGGIGRFRDSTRLSIPLPLTRCFGTCAYTISPAGARKFRNACFPLTSLKVNFPMVDPAKENNGIDVSMNRIYPITKSFLSVPPLAVTPNFNDNSLTLTRVC